MPQLMGTSLGSSAIEVLARNTLLKPGLWPTTTRSLAIVTLLPLAGTTLLHAQGGRDGPWMGFGLGYGSASFSCDTCTGSQRLGGWMTSVELGGTLSPHVRLGAEWRSWWNGLKAGGK